MLADLARLHPGVVRAQSGGMTSRPPAELGPDTVIGSYRIVSEIGRGGMGVVYEAVHVVLPRRAAIKIMHGELKRQPGMATRMVQEASILEEVRHPGVVRVFECNVLEDHRPWIAMELVEGNTLAAELVDKVTLAPVDVATLLADVADVLSAIHARGIVHRDLKPDNLLLTPNDRDFPLRVIDWGVARLGPAGRLTLDGLTPGTPIYMSPEQATGKNVGAQCDIYSLGVIAYEALAGDPPFDGRTLAEVVCMHLTSEPQPLFARTGAPQVLCDLVHRMLDKNPARRPTSTEVRKLSRAFANELGMAEASAYDAFEVSGGEPVADSRPRGEPRLARPRAMVVPTDEVVVIDVDLDDLIPASAPAPSGRGSAGSIGAAVAAVAEAEPYGVTELQPVVQRARWTPEIGPAVARAGRTISPRSQRDQVAGEIVMVDKPR